MPMRGKLKPKDEAAIRQNIIFLKDEIDAKHIVDYLYMKDVISLDDKEEILAPSVRSRRNDALIDKLLHAGPGNAYSEFLKALDQEYTHVAQQLRKTPTANPQIRQYARFEQLTEEFKKSKLTDGVASKLAECFGNNWESVMMELNHTQATIEREKQNNGNNVVRTITSLLIKWYQKQPRVATYEKLIECLESVSQGGNVTIEFEEIEKILLEENNKQVNTMQTDDSYETLPKQEAGN